MTRRNTIQRELVLNAVNTLRKHVTADEVYEFIHKDHPNVSKGTVYRNLSILSDEEAIKKIEIPDGPDHFDFTLKDHYHIKCIKCKKIYDVDMDVLSNLKERIKDDHGMQILNYDIFFKGICPACQK